MAAKGDAYARDSLDRFGDDLYQILVSHMSFYDRFRTEEVSRQWRRLVFSGERHLLIDRQLVAKWTKRSFFGKKYTDWDVLTDILKKCRNITAVTVDRNDLQYQNVIYKIMDVLAAMAPDITAFEVHSSHGESHTDLYGLFDRIVAFKSLRHLCVDCPHVYGDSNPCANVMNKVAANCPRIRSLELNVNCFVAPNLINILKAMQWFPALERLNLGLYSINFEEPQKYSVKPLLECRRLRYVSLDCDRDMEFTDVDKLRARPLIQKVTTTKNHM